MDSYDNQKKLRYAKKKQRVDNTMLLPFIYLQVRVKR